MRKFISFLHIWLFLLFSASPVYAQNLGSDAVGLDWIQGLVRRIIQLSTGFAFIALVVILAMAGVKYLTSGGDAKSLQSANLAITWALLGMLFLAITWLVLLLLEAFTGLKLSIFDIKILCGTVPSPAPPNTIMQGCK